VKRVAVFCGSHPGLWPGYAEAARRMGATLARRGIGLVFGGGRVGLMGAVADGALGAGGEVVGVIPEALVGKELAHSGVSELKVVTSMHERKALMAELADDDLLAFVDHAVREGFLGPEHRALVVVEEEPERLLDRLRGWERPPLPRWMGREEI
jgi:predicted Rossmann-fold nucleotide-binding protein